MWESKASWKNPKWKYKNADFTDVKKTIARVRREMEKLKNAQTDQKSNNQV